ncbi:hypothetical protein J6590_070757 [Homalodisca vitripennis]|nr:hypothetical protein J6590_070757 [Homalodisca vitripennis]
MPATAAGRRGLHARYSVVEAQAMTSLDSAAAARTLTVSASHLTTLRCAASRRRGLQRPLQLTRMGIHHRNCILVNPLLHLGFIRSLSAYRCGISILTLCRLRDTSFPCKLRQAVAFISY